MRRPSAPVVFVVRTHGLVGVAAFAALVVLHRLTRDLPGVEFGPRTLLIAGGFAALYLVAAVVVWFGMPFGLILSRLCSLIYLVRPSFGFRVWDVMAADDFRAHFRARRIPPVGDPAKKG
jgi:hypothetical protein